MVGSENSTSVRQMALRSLTENTLRQGLDFGRFQYFVCIVLWLDVSRRGACVWLWESTYWWISDCEWVAHNRRLSTSSACPSRKARARETGLAWNICPDWNTPAAAVSMHSAFQHYPYDVIVICWWSVCGSSVVFLGCRKTLQLIKCEVNVWNTRKYLHSLEWSQVLIFETNF